MYWKITYYKIDEILRKPIWNTLYFTNDYTYFEIIDYLKENYILNYKLDVVNNEDVEEAEIINKK